VRLGGVRVPLRAEVALGYLPLSVHNAHVCCVDIDVAVHDPALDPVYDPAALRAGHPSSQSHARTPPPLPGVRGLGFYALRTLLCV